MGALADGDLRHGDRLVGVCMQIYINMSYNYKMHMNPKNGNAFADTSIHAEQLDE